MSLNTVKNYSSAIKLTNSELNSIIESPKNKEVDSVFEEPKKEEALRFNANKIEMELPPRVEAAFSVVCMKNSEKYGGKYPNKNYLKGAPQSQYLNCLKRHMAQYLTGEHIDPTDEIPHVFKILWNAAMLTEMYISRPDLNDIPESDNPIDFDYFLNFMKKSVDNK